MKHRHYERLDRYGDGLDWVLAALPDEGPLAYLAERPPRHRRRAGTLDACSRGRSSQPGAARETWDEVESLVHSDDSAENGDHFMVETDERRRSVLRFGNGTNGRLLPNGAVVHAEYQIGGGAARQCRRRSARVPSR